MSSRINGLTWLAVGAPELRNAEAVRAVCS